jgi:hypothetical protein
VDEIPKNMAKTKAVEAVHRLHAIIKSNVKPRIKKEGVLSAAQFCANESFEKIKQLSDELAPDISIKRISLLNRNPDAYPLESEEGILKALELIEKSDAYLPEEIVQMVDETTYKVYFPSTMSSRNCKKCHGPASNIDPGVQKFFKTKYPQDKAIGFKSGQVRGAVVVTVKINPNQRSLDENK